MTGTILIVTHDEDVLFSRTYENKTEAENAGFAYVLKHQSQSVSYATKYGGWKIKTEYAMAEGVE